MATNYYVDSDAADDTGDGTLGDPWKYINTHVGELSADDVMYLRGGSTPGTRQNYNELVVISSGNGCSSGTLGHPITITNYPDEYVRLYSSATTSAMLSLQLDYWLIEGQSFGVVSGDPYFELDRQDAGSNGYAVYITGDNNTLRYLHIHNCDYNPAIIRIQNASGNLFSYCRIHDNEASPGTDHHAFYISSSDSGTPSNDNIVEYCEIYDAAGDCFQMQTSLTGTISGTIIRYNHMYTTLGGASENAVDDKNGVGTEIYGNVMHGFRDCDGSLGGTGADGQAVIVQSGSSGALIWGNLFYDNSGASLRSDTTDVVFRNNIVRDPVYEESIGEKTCGVYASTDSIDIYNNTFVGGMGAGTKVLRLAVGATVVLRNNIFYDTNNVQDDSGATYDHNCWYSCDQVLSGTGDVTSDPLFIDEANDDYRLKSGSPCINTGIDVGLPYQGSAPDMGAFEYNIFVIAAMAYLQDIGAVEVKVMIRGAKLVVAGAKLTI